MALHRFKKGLDLPITGQPEQRIEICRKSPRVALVADDYVGMKPTMHVQEGDEVKRGQLLFEDKKREGVRYTAPGAGKVVAINRGARRALQTVVIELSPSEFAGKPTDVEQQDFENYKGKVASDISAEELRALLVESGLWTSIIQRPFGRVAAIDATPRSIFVNAMDTAPLTPDPAVVLKGNEKAFQEGLRLLKKFTEGPLYLCKAPGSDIPTVDEATVEEFEGPHPAGTSGLHIHTLDPVHTYDCVWQIRYQDVVAIAKLVETGRLFVEQVVALAGPRVKRPRLLRTRWGASLGEMVDSELEEDGENRVISGTVLDGRTAVGDVHGFLGRYDYAVSVIAEDRERVFMGWMAPGAKKFSTLPAFVSNFMPKKKFNLTTSTNGSHRAMVPIGLYENVMPFDTEPTYLLRGLAVGDLDSCEKLGALEMVEEDVALCTFVDPGKIEYGPLLREVLDTIEKEG